MTERHRSKVGPKGQVVVVKELREKHGIKEGGVVEQVSTERGVLLVPVSASGLLKELDAVAEKVGKAWPKGVSAVEAISEDREKRCLRK
jgi:AbrB family looped-hinge helix DNA binding protein